MRNTREKGMIIIFACMMLVVMLMAEMRLLPEWNGLWIALIIVVVAASLLTLWLLLRHKND